MTSPTHPVAKNKYIRIVYLLSILPPATVQTLNKVGGMAQEHGVTSGTTYHTEHGQPHVCQGLRGEPGKD